MAEKKKEATVEEVLEQQRRKDFVEKIEAVQKETGYQVVAELQYSRYGIHPTLGVIKTPTEEAKQ